MNRKNYSNRFIGQAAFGKTSTQPGPFLLQRCVFDGFREEGRCDHTSGMTQKKSNYCCCNYEI